jgi:hypothetical protein
MADGGSTPVVISKTARVSRAASITLKIAGACIVAFVVLAILSGFLMWWLAPVCLAASGVAFAVALLAGIVRVGLSLFAESQMRLSEMLATMFAGGLVGVLIVTLVGDDVRHTESPQGMRAVLGMLGFTVVSMGSVWGWGVCRRLEVQDAKRRLKHLLVGWLLAIGAVCALAFVWLVIGCCVTVMVARERVPYGAVIALLIAILGSFLVVPGVITEQMCRRKLKTQRQPGGK